MIYIKLIYIKKIGKGAFDAGVIILVDMATWAFIINSTDLPKIVKIIEAKLYIIFIPPTIIILYINVPIKYKK